MEALPIIKLAIDFALAGAVLYLAARVARRGGPSPAQISSLQALEASLARMLKDAGGASSDLQAALSKEQKKLEELLFDIETVEHRINKGLDEAQSVQRKMRRAVEETASEQRSPLREEIESSRQYEPQSQPSSEPVRYEEAVIRNTEEHRAPVAERAPVAAPVAPRATQDVPRNIYGEPIVQVAPSALAQELPQVGEPLRRSIEREVTSEQVQPPRVPLSPPTQTPVQQSLEDIYAQCEDLLRAGNSIQQVATSMNLSVDEIETLQKFMTVDDQPATVGGRAPAENSPAGNTESVSGRSHTRAPDDRLGALGAQKRNPIGRSTQVVS